jgi:alkanesulfonate monooxygenase SsuD/methylene tetrahydromethanopterin reductase-like flavin-dependent oxidoreductase (luciferase family)
VRQGAQRAGRGLEGFHTAAMVTLMLLEPGEPVDSPRVIAQVGSAVMSGLHYLVAHHEETGAEPPPYARDIWKDYLAFLDARPPEIRHRLLHESHFSWLDPDEARFLTPELIRGSCLVGTAEELVERLHALEAEGLNQVLLYPPLNRMYRVIEDFADGVMSRM